MIEGLKPLYNRVLLPVARSLFRIGFTPNKVTMAGTLLFAVAGYLTATNHWLIALSLIFVGSLFDGIDGIIAREFNLKSRFGAILDSSCDRLTEIFWLGGLLSWYLVHSTQSTTGALLCFGAITGSLMVSYVRARAEGMQITCSGGFMQRPERLILLGLCQLIGPWMMFWGLAILTILSWGTALERMIAVWRISLRD